MQNQKATNAYLLAGQLAPPYGYTASRRRPPAIPVRSRVATGQTLRPQPALVTDHHLLAGMSIVGVKTMKGFIDHSDSIVRNNSKWFHVLQKKTNKQTNKQKTKQSKTNKTNKTKRNKQKATGCQPSLKFIFDRKVF